MRRMRNIQAQLISKLSEMFVLIVRAGANVALQHINN